MSRLTIAPIVEGDGDSEAIRLLLWRTWTEVVGGEHADVLKPNVRKRGRLLKEGCEDLARAVDYAMLRLREKGGGLILLLIDAEDDCSNYPQLGPWLCRRAKAGRQDADIACVIANRMYETWFVASAESLSAYLETSGWAIPDDVDATGHGKGWIKQHMKNGKYTETADQAALTQHMDLHACRRRSRSFDKLCRELEARRQSE
jgi:hypothetical protein